MLTKLLVGGNAILKKRLYAAHVMLEELTFPITLLLVTIVFFFPPLPTRISRSNQTKNKKGDGDERHQFV